MIGAFGCSNHYRSVPTDDFSFVESALGEVVSASASGSEVSQFQQLAQTPGASIYYSDSVAYGPVESVASLGSFAFFGRPDLWYGAITEVRIFFVDAFTAQGRQAGLLLAIKEHGQSNFEVKAFVSSRPAEVVGEEYVTVLSSNGQEVLTLRTMYVDEDGELEAVVRMDVSDFSDGGLETYIGQFSTLVGYQVF